RAESNAELVEKAVALAGLFDREPATPDEARQVFGLKGRAAVAF
ncbi:MAG: 3-keto-5-aminohexanoate cleavage protein, partial [Actinobacteria bacterium]|nr:3-keto-5-aminohexanoate cleavage protein [Actinomycetota bacterium]